MRRREFLAACLCAVCTGPARAGSALVEPHMHFVPAGRAPEIAVTLDACMGATDLRILQTLIVNDIPATIFATARWIAGNADSVRLLRTHAELIRIENHGARHVPAVIGSEKPYGIAPAGSASAVAAEVDGGARAVHDAFGVTPGWYRDATALYTRDAMALVGTLGQRIAGFSLNGDIGASVPAAAARDRIAAARSGDVLISHINQPKRPAGAGVAEGLLALKARGFVFRHLDEVTMIAKA